MATTYIELPLLTELAKAYVKKAQLREQYQAEESNEKQLFLLEQMHELKDTIDSLINQWEEENPEREDLIEGTFLIDMDGYTDGWHSRLLESDLRKIKTDMNLRHLFYILDFEFEGQPEGLFFYNFPKIQIEKLLEDLKSLDSQWLPKDIEWSFDRNIRCPFFGNLDEATDYLEAYGLMEGQKLIKVKKEMFVKSDDGMGEVICTIEVEVPIPFNMAGDEDSEKYYVYRYIDRLRSQMIKKMIGFNIIFPNGEFSE